jgi:hypothetical protein
VVRGAVAAGVPRASLQALLRTLRLDAARSQAAQALALATAGEVRRLVRAKI